MKLIIRYKKPIPDSMRSLYEKAFQVAFDGCKIVWRNPKLVRLSNIENSEIKVQEAD